MFTDYLQTPVEMSPHPLVKGKEKVHVFFEIFTKTSPNNKFTPLLPNGIEKCVLTKNQRKIFRHNKNATDCAHDTHNRWR